MTTVSIVDFHTFEHEIYGVRFAVFVDEQGVPAQLEQDHVDKLSKHALVWVGDTVVGTGRLTPDGHIGRVAVLPAYRGQGVGKNLMKVLMKEAEVRGFHQIQISAQCRVVPFYEALGFVEYGDTYLEAGIEHIKMKKPI